MIEPGLYRHYKGNNYQVLCEVTHSETQETLVLYRQCLSGKHFVRPVAMFSETVVVDGKSMPRFELLLSSFDANYRY